jgi:hypothetical protein
MKEWVITSEKTKSVLPAASVKNLDTIVYAFAIGLPCFLWITFIF